MLILPSPRLVVLEVPKTGSLALRAMLEPLATDLAPDAPRHIRAEAFDRNHRAALETELGGRVELVAVVREPLRRLQSWYRYRQRDNVAALRISTREVSFNDFVADYLSPHPHPRAKLGRQDRFVGWDGARARVDHLFDYRRTDRLVAFLSDRLGTRLKLPFRNVSPEAEDTDYTLEEEVLARLLKRNAAEFDLYAAVRGAGHLVAPPPAPA
ncbi:MAG: gamma-glutamyl kinase [Pseudorhodobacter sp.]